MENAIKKIIKDADPETVEELQLDGKLQISRVQGLEKYPNLRKLSLNNIGLQTLEGFPNLPGLQELHLTDNKVQGGLEALSGLTQLGTLKLSNNRLRSVKDLQPLVSLSELKFLDLEKNPLVDSENFREEVFGLLPTLRLLDNIDREGNIVDDDDENEEDDDDDEEDAANEEDDGEVDEEEEEDDDDKGVVSDDANEEKKSDPASKGVQGRPPPLSGKLYQVDVEDDEEDEDDEVDADGDSDDEYGSDSEEPAVTGTAFLAQDLEDEDEEDDVEDFQPQDEIGSEEDEDSDDDDEDDDEPVPDEQSKRKGGPLNDTRPNKK